MIVIADVLQEARHYLQDVVPPLRHEDAELLLYLKSALAYLYDRRPDVFPSGQGCADPTLDHCNEIDLSARWASGLAFYVAACAEVKDDEYAAEDRKSAFLFTLAYQRMGVVAA